MKASPIQESLNAGEFSPLMQGRVLFQKYKNALALCENMMPIVQGAVTRRTGTYFIGEVKDSANKTRMIPFEFSTLQSYNIEFGAGYFRFYKDRGQIQVSDVAAWETSTAYAKGALVVSGSVNYYCVTSHTAGTFATDLAAGKWYALEGSIYEIPNPYSQDEIADVKYTQSADVLYLTHKNHPPIKLSRTGHTAWTTSEIDFQDGPYLNLNATETTLTLSGTTGSVTVTASASLFKSSDVGRSLRIKSTGSKWGWGKITGYTSDTVVTVLLVKSPESASATKDWRLGIYCAEHGYPSCVTFFEDRLFFAGTKNYPQRIDGSKAGDYETFSPNSIETGTVTDEMAVACTLNSSDVNAIQWMVDDEKGLLCGSIGGEWIVRPSSLSEGLTPTNIKAKRSTSYGSSSVQAKRVGRAAIYVQRAGRKVREMAYVYEVDGFRSPDMTALSEHITYGGLTEIEYQQEPFSVIWFIRSDGQLIGLTYERDQDVIGWHRHIIGGSFGDGHAIVEALSCIPTPDGTSDELTMIVKRTIDGETKRYIEYMTPRFDADSLTYAHFVDCGLTYEGAATDTVSGLNHLEKETVQVLADGLPHDDCVVYGGMIALTRKASVITIGKGYNSDIQTLRLEAGAADGTAQGKTKRITRVDVRLHKTLGLKYGRDAANLDVHTFRKSGELFSGDIQIVWNSGYDEKGQMYFRQSQPLPMTILSIAPQVVTQDR